ncbi:hypothetical protein F5Y01DRAFT_203386 [Xylaria sp. FL0043]|nr:hypothetical protein F5Y01DRAFT_203386 [Xylaria sp. FL0043]
MLQYRRTTIIFLVAFSLVYVYKLWYTSRQDEGSLSWAHQDRNDSYVRNSTLGFEKIFVINLPARRDRRDAMATAGAVSNLNLTFIEGQTGESHSKVEGARGSWASHLSVLQAIVDLGLRSVLVLEDDVDWDVRLKTQMETFAVASQMWLDVEQEKREMLSRLRNLETGKPEHEDSKAESSATSNLFPESSGEGGIKEEFERDTITLPPKLPSTILNAAAYSASPYGEDWDVLWLGHCGADLPTTRKEPPPSSQAGSPFCSSSSLKIAVPGDTTVPAPKHLQPHPFALRDALADAYPPHTRVVHAACGNVCSLAYGVSQRGARRLLRRFTGDGYVAQWDLMLRDYCMGTRTNRDKEEEGGGGGGGGERGEGDESLVCLTVQPPLISHHYAGEEGGASVSDIKGQGGGLVRGKKGTPYIRLSVQENLERLVAGVPVERLVDQLPDDGDTLW